jgi:hypothetical protein
MNRTLMRRGIIIGTLTAVGGTAGSASAFTSEPAQVAPLGDWQVQPIFSFRESAAGCFPPGILDGARACILDVNPVRGS